MKYLLMLIVMTASIANAGQHFKTASAVPMPELIQELQKVYNEQIKDKEIVSISVEGHTDQRASVAYNKKLSEARAKSAVDVLVKFGADRSKFTSVGKGKSELLAAGTSDEDFAKNRRVVVIVKSKAGTTTAVISEAKKCEEKVVEKIVEKVVEKKAAPLRNRISLLAGKGPRDGLDRSNSPSLVEVESRVGTMAGIQYQRLLPVLNDRLSIGGQALTNKTFMLELGLDF